MNVESFSVCLHISVSVALMESQGWNQFHNTHTDTHQHKSIPKRIVTPLHCIIICKRRLVLYTLSWKTVFVGRRLFCLRHLILYRLRLSTPPYIHPVSFPLSLYIRLMYFSTVCLCRIFSTLPFLLRTTYIRNRGVKIPKVSATPSFTRLVRWLLILGF